MTNFPDLSAAFGSPSAPPENKGPANNARFTADLQIAYDLALRMAGLHTAERITKEQALDVYKTAYALLKELKEG